MNRPELINCYGLAAGGKPVRAWLREVMSGAIALADVPERWRPMVSGMMMLPLYRNAVLVLSYPTRDERAAALAAVPAGIRPAVEAAARSIHEIRRSSAAKR